MAASIFSNGLGLENIVGKGGEGMSNVSRSVDKRVAFVSDKIEVEAL